MRIRFMGLANIATLAEINGWQPAYVDVKDEAELEQLRKITDGVAPLEHISRWESNDELTGVMLNFCFTPNCQVCGNK